MPQNVSCALCHKSLKSFTVSNEWEDRRLHKKCLKIIDERCNSYLQWKAIARQYKQPSPEELGVSRNKWIWRSIE